MADGQAIIRQFLQRYRKHFETEQIELLLGKDKSGRLNKVDADKPLYLVTVLEELRTLGTCEEIANRIAELPPNTQALFRWILKRLEDDDGFRNATGQMIGKELAAPLTSFLALSRNGLSQNEFFELLDAGDPQGNIAAMLHLLRPYLMHRGELLDFYHSQFRQAVTERYHETKESRRAYHATLADYFDGRERLTDRKVSEWPYHLAQAEKWTQLRDAITSPNLCMELSGAAVNELWDYASALPEFKGKLYDIVKDCPDRWLAELGETSDYELALNELAFQLCECEEKSAAQDMFSRTCKLAQDMYGKDDIRTAIRLHNHMACLTMNEHKYEEALDILRKVVPIFQEHFGEHGGNTMDARISLGIAQYSSGDISNGIGELLSCKTDSIRYLGKGHGSTVNAILALGNAYGFIGEFAKAAEHNQEATKLSERILGTNHPHVSKVKDSAAKWARVVQLQLQAGRHEDSHKLKESQDCFEEMAAIGEALACEAVMAVSLFGRSRIRLLLGHTAEAARDIELARKFADVGMPDFAKNISDFISQQEVLLSHIQNGDVSNTVLDRDMSRDLNNKAIELRNKGELDEAEQLLRKSLEIEIEQRGESHPKIAHRLNNLSTVLVLRNRLDEAKHVLARAWQLKASQHDITSSRVLYVRLVIALLESQSAAVFVGQLRTLLAEEYLRDYAGVDSAWNVAYFLEQLNSKLGERNAKFMVALAAVMNNQSTVSELDRFPEWCSCAPVSLETPWSA